MIEIHYRCRSCDTVTITDGTGNIPTHCNGFMIKVTPTINTVLLYEMLLRIESKIDTLTSKRKK